MEIVDGACGATTITPICFTPKAHTKIREQNTIQAFYRPLEDLEPTFKIENLPPHWAIQDLLKK